MSTIHRHRFELIIMLLIIAGFASSLWYLQRDGSPQYAQAASAQQQPTEETLNAATFTAVQSLRHDLALTDRDLAAMGVSEQTAAAIMTALVQWRENNSWQLDNGRQSQQSARRDLAEAMRQVHIGPRDEGVIGSVPSLRNAVAAADSSYAQMIEGGAQAVSHLLSSEQSAIWLAARTNRDAPSRYRYAPNLTREQRDALAQALRRVSRSRAGFADAEQSQL